MDTENLGDLDTKQPSNKGDTMSKYTVLFSDGRKSSRKSPISLEKAQKFVGGYVEVVRLGGRKVLLVNEDARVIKNRPPVNKEASNVAGQEILGNAVVLESLNDLRDKP